VALLVIGAAGLAACGTRTAERPVAGRSEPFARPLDIYRDVGFLTGSGDFPVVASFATLAGPADSTWVIMGLSMPNSALRFQRDEYGFYAEYDVAVTFIGPDSLPVRTFATRETVRIATFTETGRTDESVVFQHAFALPPGHYRVQLEAVDVNSARGFRMADTITAPAYGTAGTRVSAPVIAYRAAGRSDRSAPPDLILNPRHTVPFGGAEPVLYIEAYAPTGPLAVSVVSGDGAALWHGQVPIRPGTASVHYGVLRLPAAALPLGRFWVHVHGAARERSPLILTISDQWMVSNLDEVLQFLRYIAWPVEIDSLRTGSPAEQRERWERFWERRNPIPIAGLNEFRDQFFQRVRTATEAFREPGGRAGWQTDRGEVFIVLGPPDQAVERYLGRNYVTGMPNAIEWVYAHVAGGRLNLLFYDRTGFGRFELVPASAAAFRAAAERMKPRGRRAAS
jgi:GWxTD domain-containing protein